MSQTWKTLNERKRGNRELDLLHKLYDKVTEDH